LRDRLREELGGTYSINVRADIAWQPVESYTITIAFGSDPERTEELTASVFAEIEGLSNSGPTAEQVADVREALLLSFETDFQENRTLLNQLVSDYRRGEVPGASIRSYPSSVEALTPASIQQDARQYLDLENWIRVTLLPER
jgi:zinc protease